MKISIFWVYILLISVAFGNFALAQDDEFSQPGQPEISEDGQPPLPLMDGSGDIPPQPAPDDDEVYID
jgi:hypothetical protein